MATLTTAPGRASTHTTIAMKIVMALSGALFVLFVAAHMYGNLKLFSGQLAFDEYAHHLRTFGEPILPYSGFLWVLRISLVTHLHPSALRQGVQGAPSMPTTASA